MLSVSDKSAMLPYIIYEYSLRFNLLSVGASLGRVCTTLPVTQPPASPCGVTEPTLRASRAPLLGVPFPAFTWRRGPGDQPGRGPSALTFSHSPKGVLVGLIGHPAHHVGHAQALLVRGARGHGVPFGERGISRV